MKLTNRVIVPACLLGIIAGLGFAQQARPSVDREAGDRDRSRPRHSERSQRPERPRHQLPPLVRALDADHNGELSADEIAKAPAALASLDGNGDGILTREELAPARPPHPHGPPPRGRDRDRDRGQSEGRDRAPPSAHVIRARTRDHRSPAIK